MTTNRNRAAISRRRYFLHALGTSLLAQTELLRAQTATTTLRRVGLLVPSTRAKEEVTLKPFFDQMRELGWTEGQNVSYDRVYAGDRQQDLPRLATELVARRPELIYAPPQIAAMAAWRATRTIPILFATGSDPVGAGLVLSLAHPGGNVTGILSTIESLAPKRLELLREILPNARRIGVVGNPSDPRLNTERSALAAVAPSLGLTILVAHASNPLELDAAVTRLLGQRVDAIIGTTSVATNLREQLTELANRGRVPWVGSIAAVAEAGALLSYGSMLPDQLRRSAQLVDKVLKGAKPADMPVEQPTRFELIVNLKAAKALGITVPRALLLRADEVVQ